MTAVKVTAAWHFAEDGSGCDRRAITVTLPIRTISESNHREHHMARHRRRSAQKQTAKLIMTGALRAEGIKAPCDVHLVRVAPSDGLDEHDNLRTSLKLVVDGIAAALELDDADPRVSWSYDQRRGGPKEYAVIVRVTERRG